MRAHQTVTVIAIIAGLGILFGLPTPAGAGDHAGRATPSVPAIKPPVITEDFKPVLSCDPKTTVGMEGCGEHKVLAADKQLNTDSKVIFGLLYDNTSRRDFITAQTKWAAYRSADCQSQSDVYEGGTEQPVAFVYCLATDDSLRHQDLKGFFDGLVQGRAGRGTPFP